MYRENYINALRTELLKLVEERLSPVGLKYGYTSVPLETNIKWRPLVLVLGNYSSGKSTLINEFLGAHIQATGQAPTDDSFTIITYDDQAPEEKAIAVQEERDGKFLLSDPEFPFETLKKHGQRFAAHFRYKKVNSPFLKNLALIDTPGMLDSVSERNRGYDYQEVIGDLAQIADLVLILFDPHKAGTVREAYTSLRDTLPARTFEDRVLFVLNRIDECASLLDLIRVYGTLCWNLSQMTGRKDIPLIHLTYSRMAQEHLAGTNGAQPGFLDFLGNQIASLKSAILQAPRHRLDHLASFVETHSERLSHFLEALVSYRRQLRGRRFKIFFSGLVTSLALGGLAVLGLVTTQVLPASDPVLLGSIGGGTALAILVLWMMFVRKVSMASFHRKRLAALDNLTPLENQTRQDSWDLIRDLVHDYLKSTEGRYSLNEVRREHKAVQEVYKKGSQEIRSALSELATIPEDEESSPQAAGFEPLSPLTKNPSSDFRPPGR